MDTWPVQTWRSSEKSMESLRKINIIIIVHCHKSQANEQVLFQQLKS